MSRSILVITLLAALMISACSFSGPETLKSGLPALEGNWMISFAQSGGIMGLSRSIEISADGKYTVSDDRAGAKITKELNSTELFRLKDIVANSQYITMQSPLPSSCADCFVYDLVIQGNVEKFTVELDDISLPDSGMGTLITYIRELMDSTLN